MTDSWLEFLRTSEHYISKLTMREDVFLETVKVLISSNENDYINSVRCSGMPLICIAAKNGHVEVIKALLMADKAHTNGSLDVNNASDDGCTALSIALKNLHVDIVEALFKRNAMFIGSQQENSDVKKLSLIHI